MKLRKAPGWDMVEAEHVRYGGESLVRLLTIVFNGMVELEYSPFHMKRGVMIPIPKSGKDSTIKDNNRGITVGPIFNKLYEKLLVKRWYIWQREQKVMNQVQGASHEFCSCIHTNWLLRETISYNRGKGETVWVCLMDIKKAFDSVWTNGMLYQLYQTGVEGKMWRIIQDMYEGYESCVKLGKNVSDWFPVQQGVHQGAPFSMILFQIHINPLLNKIISSGLGAKIGNIPIGCPTSADDMAIITLSEANMQQLVDISYAFSIKWRFGFSSPKCMVLVYGDTVVSSVTLGTEILQQVLSAKHLGTILVTVKNADVVEYERRLTEARKTVYSFLSLGDWRSPVSPLSAAKVYRSKALPIMLYGVGVSNMSEKAKATLENGHWMIAKHIQGISPKTPNVAVLRTMGWLSMEAYIHVEQLSFLVSVIQLHPDNLYKRVARYLFMGYVIANGQNNGNSPMTVILKTAKKVGLFDQVCEAFEEGIVVTKYEWKRRINQTVSEYDERKWRVTCSLYKDNGMENYREILPEKYTDVWPWWRHAYQRVNDARCCMSLLRLCTGDVPIYDHNCNVCKLCMRECTGRKDVHMIFLCEKLHEKRTILWAEVLQSMPRAMRNDVEAMSDEQKYNFLSSGMVTYTPEWCDIYERMIRMVHTICQESRSIILSEMPS